MILIEDVQPVSIFTLKGTIQHLMDIYRSRNWLNPIVGASFPLRNSPVGLLASDEFAVGYLDRVGNLRVVSPTTPNVHAPNKI